VPVLLRLAGPAAWYLPGWLARLLPRVHFGHGDAAASGRGHTGPAGTPPPPVVVES
jgi:hypothetical protein